MINYYSFLPDCKAAILAVLLLLVFGDAAVSFAQDDVKTTIDVSKVPATAESIDGFIPAGWKLEEQIKGDVTGDKNEDILLQLIEDKPAKADTMTNRERALVVLVKTADGKWQNAAVADKLLQCTQCGGAFYGFMDAPASVTIEKGAIVVSQDHGSRWVSEISFRFRYDKLKEKFFLIGFDYSTRDRAEASVVSESINYLTGKRVATNSKRRKTRTTVAKKRVSIAEVDSETFEAAAAKRLGVD